MPSPFHRILVGWDGSPASHAALTTAAAIADHGGTVIAHAVLRPAAHTETNADRDTDLHDQRTWLQSEFDQAVPQLGAHGGHVRLEYSQGSDIADDLSRAADQHGCDLIVIGRHGSDTHVRTAGLGPVAYALTRQSALPVLLLGPAAT